MIGKSKKVYIYDSVEHLVVLITVSNDIDI